MLLLSRFVIDKFAKQARETNGDPDKMRKQFDGERSNREKTVQV